MEDCSLVVVLLSNERGFSGNWRAQRFISPPSDEKLDMFLSMIRFSQLHVYQQGQADNAGKKRKFRI